MKSYQSFKDYIFESEDLSSYDNWVRYDAVSLDLDFREYKLKEYKKWQSRAQQNGFIFPMFTSKEDLQQKLDDAQVVDIDKDIPSGVYTKNYDVEDVKRMVGSYFYPRDVDRIVKGFNNNVQMPYPIVVKGKTGYYSLAGNTRQAVARVLGITPKALLIDLSKKAISESPVQYGDEAPVEWGFYDPINNKYHKPIKNESDEFEYPDEDGESRVVEHHNQLARLIGYRDKESALVSGLIAFETYSSGSSEVDGYTSNAVTLKAMAKVLSDLRSATGSTQWTFYRKGLPGDTETPEEAILILRQLARKAK